MTPSKMNFGTAGVANGFKRVELHPDTFVVVADVNGEAASCAFEGVLYRATSIRALLESALTELDVCSRNFALEMLGSCFCWGGVRFTCFNDFRKVPRLHLIAHLVRPFPSVRRTVGENHVSAFTHFDNISGPSTLN